MIEILLAHITSQGTIRVGLVIIAVALFAACLAAVHVPRLPRGWFQ